MSLTCASDRDLHRGHARVARRALTYLVASLCLIALQHLPFHVLADAHHGHHGSLHASSPLHEAVSDGGQHDPHHPGLEHQVGRPAKRAAAPGSVGVLSSARAVVPPSLTLSPAAVLAETLPPAPDTGPPLSRGPPRSPSIV